MKFAILSLLAAIVGAALGLVAVFLGFARSEVAVDDGGLRRELAAAHATIGELADRIGRLERSLANVENGPTRSAAVRLPQVDQLPSAETPAAPRVGEPAFDPRRLLAEYVASFEGGGEGSDFFRMAVAAYAWQLRRELQIIVVDRDAPDALRLQVMAMLDGGSFRGDGATIDALLAILRQGGWEAGETAALGVLAKIGDRRTAELIEAVASGLEPLRVRASAWAAIAQLCGGDADSVLLRLFEREQDPEGRQQLIALFRGTDLAATLRAYELASRMEKNVRLDAASRIGRFREESFGVLIDDWVGRETDDEVRARLLAAQEQRKQVPSWHELQATGAPNVASLGNDDPHAWAPASPDGGKEWLELAYATPLVANRVTIHETCAAGSVIAVDLMDERGTWRPAWSGDDPLTAAGPFEVRFATTSAPIKRVRITLDTARRPGWNEIDAVELAGPDGAAWATEAHASSRYGERAWGSGRDFEQGFLGSSGALLDALEKTRQERRR